MTGATTNEKCCVAPSHVEVEDMPEWPKLVQSTCNINSITSMRPTFWGWGPFNSNPKYFILLYLSLHCTLGLYEQRHSYNKAFLSGTPNVYIVR